MIEYCFFCGSTTWSYCLPWLWFDRISDIFLAKLVSARSVQCGLELSESADKFQRLCLIHTLSQIMISLPAGLSPPGTACFTTLKLSSSAGLACSRCLDTHIDLGRKWCYGCESQNFLVLLPEARTSAFNGRQLFQFPNTRERLPHCCQWKCVLCNSSVFVCRLSGKRFSKC